jgi:Zn-dependent M28 family amino/carboxypeptidase
VALLELARRIGGVNNRDGRRVVFIAFTGEETGLVGSAHYCKNPLFPLDKTAAMLNMDMVGRLRPDSEDKSKDKLTVYGTGSAKSFDQLIEKLNGKVSQFKISKVASGTGPSDHTSFYMKGVPVYFFFTGNHKEYHTPADTVETINFAGIRRVAELVEATALALAGDPNRPEYVKTQSTGMSPGRMNVPRLGFMPGNYDEEEGKGVLIGGLTKDGPGEKGGLKEGDYIVEVGGKPVRNMAGYMTVMSSQKKGQPIELTVKRGDKQLKVKVTPQ